MRCESIVGSGLVPDRPEAGMNPATTGLKGIYCRVGACPRPDKYGRHT